MPVIGALPALGAALGWPPMAMPFIGAAAGPPAPMPSMPFVACTVPILVPPLMSMLLIMPFMARSMAK